MYLSKFSLQGKVALVTGGSHGIGRATALGLAEAGADVVVSARNLPDLKETAEEIRTLNQKSLPVVSDMRNMEEITRLVEIASDEFGQINILVNNAGGAPDIASVLDSEEWYWESVIDLNLKSVFFLSQAVAKKMKEQGGGSIINVASVDGFRPSPDLSIYSIGKAGVIHATKAMARELAPYNIRVNAIAPGAVNTRLLDFRFQTSPGRKEELMQIIPMKRIADPEELVGAMIYLASDASSYTTGCTILIDGGLT